MPRRSDQSAQSTTFAPESSSRDAIAGAGEAGEDRNLHRADVRAGVRGDGDCGAHRHEDRDALARLHAELDERLGELRRLLRRLGPGQRLAPAVFALPDERLVVRPFRRPAMQADPGRVQPAADEPRRPLRPARGVDDGVPGPGELDPEIRDDGGPEAVGLVDGDPVQLVVIGRAERAREPRHVRLLDELRARAPDEAVGHAESLVAPRRSNASDCYGSEC